MNPLPVPTAEPRARMVMTVCGAVSHETLGITDAHNHVWISPVKGAAPESPVLDDFEAILKELVAYREAGATSLLDCQPGGCGRDGNKLLELSAASGVQLIACTGFHRRRYYPAGSQLWESSADTLADQFVRELEVRLIESQTSETPVRAGFIKIALEAAWRDCPQAAMAGAALAAVRTGALIEIHTERGALAERAFSYFTRMGVAPRQLVFCHMDKRPDASLHRALVEAGAALEYDTFHRPKYEPAARLWPLLDAMVGMGCGKGIALATDMAEAASYHFIGGGPGLSSLPIEIRRQLQERGYTESIQHMLLGGNIARRLAGLN